MKAAPLPDRESDRLNALRRYGILDTPPEPAFDELTQLTGQICAAPIALIAFVDQTRQWFKARVGLEESQTARDLSFCAWAILQPALFLVEDATADARFSDHPWVRSAPGIRFYAGMPLRTPDGYHLGTLCVYDRVQRTLTDAQATALRTLARQVVTQLELRQRRSELAQSIEQQKRTADRLSTSEAFYQTLVETLPQNILRKDTQGRFTFANQKFCKSIGKPLEEILDRTDFDFFPPELASKYYRDDLRVMATQEHLDTIEAHQTPKGIKQFVHVLKTPLYDSLGRVVGIQGIFWDVTQRKKIEEALAYERDLLRSLLNNLPDRIYFKDVESRYIRCSASMAKWLGLQNPMDVVGRTDFDFHSRTLTEQYFAEEQRLLLTGQPIINQLEKQTDSAGGETWAAVTKVPIYSQSGSVTGLIGIARDVTQLKQAEVALQQARDSALESARLKSEFLANMSHEIRTPMNAITGMTGLLLETRLNAEQKEFVETIRASTTTLLGTINEILDFSKIEAGKLTFEVVDFDLREIVEETVEMLAERAQRKGLELVCWIDQDVPPWVKGDPGRFRQILVNLASNAVKFTEQGEVLVRASRMEETDTNVVIRVAVTDTGIGIDARAMPRIFESFTQADGSTTRKYGGTGLGLSISKQLVELMHGQISAESAVGFGSTFWFQIPFEKQVPSPTPKPPDPARADLSALRILVVDDTATQREALRHQLAHWRMHSEVAAGEHEALTLLRNAAAALRPFDLTILDMDMPAPDGLTLAQNIKATPAISGTRLIMLTSVGHRLSSIVMRNSGVSACISKPVRWSRLRDCLIEVVSAGSGTVATEPVGTLVAEPEFDAAARSARILVAEDNIVNQRLVIRQLKKLGFQAEAVANGPEVLDALQRVPYDVVFMDCQMPEMDGYEVSRRIRRVQPPATGESQAKPYIVALTANALHGDRERCLAAGMDDYLSKPLHMADLSHALRKAIQRLKPTLRPSAAAPTQAVLDPTVIAGLKELREPGQPDPLRQLIQLFLTDSLPRLQQMQAACEKKQATPLAAAAHALKGSASNLGAKRLAGFCATLEAEAKAGYLAEAADLIRTIETEFEHVQRALLAELES